MDLEQLLMRLEFVLGELDEISSRFEKYNGIPYELRAIGAEEAAALFGIAYKTFMQRIANRPDFPQRVNANPAAWVAGEVLKYRDANRALPRGKRRQKPRD